MRERGPAYQSTKPGWASSSDNHESDYSLTDITKAITVRERASWPYIVDTTLQNTSLSVLLLVHVEQRPVRRDLSHFFL